MSGFEIAGIVLGALPLIIYALENLRDEADRLGRIADFEAEYRKIWGEVEDEELLYRLQLLRLLRPLVRDGVLAEAELDNLMLDTSADSWKEPNLTIGLERRLGDSYRRYLANLNDIQQLAWQILKPLLQSSCFRQQIKIDKTQQAVPRTRLITRAYDHLVTRFEHEHDRLKFAFTQRRRSEILVDIHRKIKILERILGASDEVATFEPNTKIAVSPKAVNNLVGYWRHADRVYTLISSSWICHCKQSHCAHLWLQHRTTAGFEFCMLVMFEPNSCRTSKTSPWQQHGIRIILQSLTGRTPESVSAPAVLPLPQTSVHPSDTATQASKVNALSKKAKPKQRVSRFESHGTFSGENTIPFARHTVPAPTQRPTLSYFKPASQARELKKTKTSVSADAAAQRKDSQDVIKNLCRTMAHCGMQQDACLGVFVDEMQGGQYQVRSQPEQKVVPGEVALSAVLKPGHKPRFTRAQRFSTALNIASSHLQLHSTPWARKQWEAADVSFPQTGTDGRSILVDRPFVTASFEPIQACVSHEDSKLADRSFACLGIMLLELLFDTRIEEHDLWQQLGIQNAALPLFRLMVAKKWADDVEGEGGAEYFKAVNWCLNRSPRTLDGDEWRRDLASEVVLPLQHCCEWINPGIILMGRC